MKYLSLRSLTGGAFASLVGSLMLLIVLWHVSAPAASGPLGILIVFILIYVFFTAAALLLISVVSLIMSRVLGKRRIPNRRRYYIGSVLGFLPVLYITSLSMGGVSIWGVILIILFIGLMLFYVIRRSA